MISIGKSIPMINPNLGVLVTTGGVLEQIGWGVIGNLHISRGVVVKRTFLVLRLTVMMILTSERETDEIVP
ncbi:hypothetical protein [Streptococcus sanguinis]|uniref:hypothetical protein n=1 Tax=Streptococcus sanguinis TaxID=1305 RepID=UPI0039C15F74